MIYAIAQTVAFASLAGAVFTSSVSPALPLLPKPQKNSFIKSFLDKASAAGLKQNDIEDEEDINALTFSARTATGTVGDEDSTPYYIEFGFYSDGACNVKETAAGYRMNTCEYDDDKDRSYMFQVFGKKSNKIKLSYWSGDGCSGKTVAKVYLLDYYLDASGKPPRLGRCQENTAPSYSSDEFLKIQVIDDYPSRKPSTNGQVGMMVSYFKEPAECTRNDYSNFYEYEYVNAYSSPCENIGDDRSFFVMCSRNSFKYLYFDEIGCNGVNVFNDTTRNSKCSLVKEEEVEEDENFATRHVYSTYCV